MGVPIIYAQLEEDAGMLTEVDRRGSRARRAPAIILSIGALLTSLLIATPALADEAEEESHCVIDVLDVLLGGEFVTSEPVCFPTFEEAMAFIGAGDLGLDSGEQLFMETPSLDGSFDRARPVRAQKPVMERPTASSSNWIIGIHFKGRGGSGSSISVTGSSCTGGYWNASSSWRNVISSSYNGCVRLAHYSQRNLNGSRYDTYGAGQTDSIYGSMDNNTESVRYLGS